MNALRILLIDDDPDVAESLAEFLELEGHAVEIALTGHAGIEAAARGHHDQIIIDVGLPDLTGVECSRSIRDVHPEARILLVSGHSAAHLDGSGIDTGTIEVLTKPFDLDNLLERLRAVAHLRTTGHDRVEEPE